MRTIPLLLVLLLSNVAETVAARVGDVATPAAALSSTTGGSGSTPVADAGARTAQSTPAKSERRGMSTGSKVAALGMLVGGVGTAVYGWRAREGCYDYREYDTCGDFRRKYYAVGGILIGSGATLLVIAESRRGARRTSVGVTEGRLTLQHRVAF